MTPRVPFDPTDASFLQDPYPTYARLREHSPIFLHEPWGKWIVLRHRDVTTLLRDRRLGRVIHHRLEAHERPVPNPEHAPFARIQAGSLLEIEPPDHTRIRSVVHEQFTPKHVRALTHRIAELCSRLADRLEAKPEREADLLTEFAEPIPVTVIAELLGVPEADRQRLVPWSKGIIGMFEPERTPEMERDAVRAADEFSAYIRETLVPRKRAEPADDLVSRLVRVRDETPDSLSEDELVANAILFLNAGHEAVVNVMGNGAYALLSHPGELERLRADATLLPSAVEEMLRYDTPLQFFERFVLEDLEYEGFRWAKGTKLCLYYGSANRDPEAFRDPERFDVGRSPNPHVAFGMGLHFCIGAPLARIELAQAFGTLLERFPELRLVTTRPERHPKNVFRYLKELRVAY